MKIAENHKEIISLWEEEYPSLIGEWRTDKQKNGYGYSNQVTYPFRQECSLVNAITLLEPSDWDKAIELVTRFNRGKHKSECLASWFHRRQEYTDQLAKDQNKITLKFGKYIQPTFECFWDQLLEDSGYWGNRKNQHQINSEIRSYKERSNYESLCNVYQNLIQPLNSYFLCKNELTKTEKVMSMVRFSINNGSTLEEIASSMGNIQKAASEISTEQSEELVNT